MRILGVPVLLLMLTLQGVAQEKAAYDIDPATWGNAQEQNTGVLAKTAGDIDHAMIGNPVSQASLLRDGYFTFGTTKGRSSGATLDDYCQLTFGHPYALTSFIEFSWDGAWQRVDRFFSDEECTLRSTPDTLEMTAERTGMCRLTLRIVQDSTGVLTLEAALTNLSPDSHDAALALQLDAALGRWGDAAVYCDGALITHAHTMKGISTGSPVVLQERADAEYGGIRAELRYPAQAPDSLQIMNWQPALGENFDARIPRPARLFDVVLRPAWATHTLAQDEPCTAAIAIEVLEPRFPRKAFMRWDMPTALALSDGVLVPAAFPTKIETFNAGGTKITRALVGMEEDPDAPLRPVDPYVSLDVRPRAYAYSALSFAAREVYQETVLPLRLLFVEDGTIVDSLWRWVYIPAAALVDTGLAISIDTVETDPAPDVHMYFTVTNEETGVPVLDLRPDHITLFENGQRIPSFTLGKDDRSTVNAVDVVFVLDVTGSMSNEIAAVRDNVQEFADLLTQQGVSIRLGLITFTDELEEIFEMTDDVQQFKQWVGAQSASGGGDSPENSLDALHAATALQYRPTAHRVVIWITDAGYHENDGVTQRTVEELLPDLLGAACTVHCIGNRMKRDDYERITYPTAGSFYDINGKFRDILLDIGRFDVSPVYKLTYVTPDPGADSRLLELEVHYGGRGGNASWVSPAPPGMVAVLPSMHCYPNPFNPTVTIAVRDVSGPGLLTVHDIRGREVARYRIDGAQKDYMLQWSAGAGASDPLPSGVYLVRLNLRTSAGMPLRTSTRIVYAK